MTSHKLYFFGLFLAAAGNELLPVFMLDLKSTSFQAAAADGKCRSVVCVEGCRKVGLLLDHFCELCETVLTLAARCVCVQGWVSASVYSLLFSLWFTTSERRRKTQRDFPTASEQKHKNKNNRKTCCRKRRREKAMLLWLKTMIE